MGIYEPFLSAEEMHSFVTFLTDELGLKYFVEDQFVHVTEITTSDQDDRARSESFRIRSRRKNYLDQRREYYLSLPIEDLEPLWKKLYHNGPRLDRDEEILLRDIVRFKMGINT